MQLLWALVHALERASKRMTSDMGVTGPQRLVLRVVGLAPRLSAGELAGVLHVHPSTLTGVLERLTAQRLLTRVADRGDRRRAVLTLTKRGATINEMRQGTAEAAVSDALSGLRASERATARHVLQRLTHSLDMARGSLSGSRGRRNGLART
jgi:DNA-binding MarR family transcriptional regulator